MSQSVRVGIIGMGNVGPAVGSALRASGAQIVGVSARSEAAVDRADAILPGVPVLPPEQVAAAAEILVLAVPDQQIAPLTEELVDTGAVRPGMVVVHLSGALGLSALDAATRIGAIPIALHPVMTFSGTSLDVGHLQGAPVAYTAPALAQPVAKALIEYLGGVPFPVEEDQRPLYHAGVTHAANHLVTLVTQGEQIIRSAGLEDPSEVLRPLLQTSLERALSEGGGGLTGPAARGDETTLAAHLDALQKNPQLREALTTYRTLLEATRDLVQSGKDDDEHTDSTDGAAQPLEDSASLRLCRTRRELLDALEDDPRPTALVMTMGALHEGHLSLVSQARLPGHKVVATIFVNPQQFGPDEDYEAYPRDLDADLAALAQAGVDVVYAPEPNEVYPIPPQVHVQPGPQARTLEGALRPGHFAGVLQIVAKMFNLIRPRVAVFGQKDAQQFANIAQMVRDLDFPIDLIQAPIIRDEDGLALSSRNAYLTREQRESALALSAGLRAGEVTALDGGTAHEVVSAAAAVFAGVQGVELQYVALADAASLAVVALEGASPESVGIESLASLPRGAAAYLLVAAKVGDTRLIDNVLIEVKDSDR